MKVYVATLEYGDQEEMVGVYTTPILAEQAVARAKVKVKDDWRASLWRANWIEFELDG